MERFLRIFLIFIAIYLFLDGLIHLLNLRLSSVAGIWPQSAISYATLLNTIYASFVFLAGSLMLAVAKDLKKYRDLISLSAVWALMHGFLLIYLSLSQNFSENLSKFSSLVVWIPFYDLYLLFEAVLAFVYAAFIFYWISSSRSNAGA